MRVFVWAFAPKPRMLVFGAIDFAAAVAKVGSFLGYQVTVCDARPVFATATRFPSADEVVVDWPHRYLAAEAGIPLSVTASGPARVRLFRESQCDLSFVTGHWSLAGRPSGAWRPASDK